MDVLNNFENLPWCKPNWSFPDVGEESVLLLKQCSELPKIKLSDDIQEIIRKSKEFPISFPISTVRLEELKEKRPLSRLKKNVVSTYPVIHERVLILMARFLAFKREFGTNIEKEFYKNMTVADLIDRILKKRAITFICAYDKYKLLSGETGTNGWESVGTPQQKPPLLLENCLSYDEMKISSMVYVSGYTECINDGARRNKGIVKDHDIEDHAVIIGIIGPRFKRKNRMEYEDVIITEVQNTTQNGFGESIKDSSNAKCMWRKMWSEFYQVPSLTYTELKSKVSIKEKPENVRYTHRHVMIPLSKNVFDNEAYYKRICITAECALLEAEERARVENKCAFLNIIGAGLGVWRATPHQDDVYVLTFMERVQALLSKDLLNHVSDVNLAFIQPNLKILELFTTNSGGDTKEAKKLFFKSEKHPRGGINVQLESRNPSSKLTGEHEGKLLVMTYAWDGNAHPGNEFWIGNLDTSGDPAAACSTQVAELHNAHVNSAVSAANTRVVGRSGVASLQEYSGSLISYT